MKKIKTVTGLKELDAKLDSLVDPKFRKAALRNAARKTMNPVKATLISKLPDGEQDNPSSYAHYKDGQGYQSGDLRKGVKLQVKVNTDAKIKFKSNGYAKDNQASELLANLTFSNKVYGLASILENGRSKREAVTRNGKVFHSWGKPTDDTHRDIGTTAPKHFVSETYAEHEAAMFNTFKQELTSSIAKQVKKMEKQSGK